MSFGWVEEGWEGDVYLHQPLGTALVLPALFQEAREGHESTRRPLKSSIASCRGDAVSFEAFVFQGRLQGWLCRCELFKLRPKSLEDRGIADAK